MAALGMAAAAMAVMVLPASAQDIALADLPTQLIAPVEGNSFLTADPAAEVDQAATAAPQTLTPSVLAAYIAKQEARKGFDIFGQAPQPQLTSALLSAYAATHYQPRNAALGAIDAFASPAVALATTFSAEDEDNMAAAAATPSITDDILARYASHNFVPTERKVQHAAAEKNCLTKAIYHEARGESLDGQWAVANVIINRAMSKRFPSTMCGVVYQNANQGLYRCQFSFACDGRPELERERRAWMKANEIAAAAYAEFQHGQRPGVLPDDALYYHTTSVSTNWGYRRVARIGSHVFFSPM
jgi:spore germination cell wall hydrolase CwlJ-like protein